MNKEDLILNYATTFHQLCFLHAVLDQCEKLTSDEPFQVSTESFSFSYLLKYISYLSDRERLSTDDDDVIFESIVHLKSQFNRAEQIFFNLESFLNVFHGEFKKEFLKLNSTYILPLVERDAKDFSKNFEQLKIIFYHDGYNQIGFPKESVIFFRSNIGTIRKKVDDAIKDLDFSYLKPKVVYDTLEEILSVMYRKDDADIGAMARIHLFGIAYHEELENMTYREKQILSINSTGKESLAAEIAKGANIGKYVTINDINSIPILRGSKYEKMEKERKKDLYKDLQEPPKINIISNESEKENEISTISAYSHNDLKNVEDLNIEKVKAKEENEFSKFEKEFNTQVNETTKGITWNYKGQSYLISKLALKYYEKQKADMYKVLKLITLDRNYDGQFVSAGYVCKKINSELL